jgi:fumigallin biosynthesis monooxygenase-like protein
MPARVRRETVDLSGYPDLIVIYLGMRVRTPRGMLKFLKLGVEIRKSVDAEPDGLLLHENFFFSPIHGCMRQYWRDFQALEAWTRTLPHQAWWRDFLHDSGGTGFWHELYSIRGGMEAVYDDMPAPLGFGTFAPREPARGRLFGARGRLAREGEAPEPVLSEGELG